jgi:hypothetical protein
MKKALFSSFTAAAAIAAASPAYAGTCPAFGSAADCNLLVTINSDGSLTITNPDPNAYDGSEDQLVGVINNSASTINSLNLSGSFIFGFDGDGIQGYGSTAPSTGLPGGYVLTGYEGPDNYFSITNSNSGSVNFINGLAGGGGFSYFSLEEPASVAGAGIGITIGSVPEPSTWAMMLLGFAGIGVAARTRRKRQLAIA